MRNSENVGDIGINTRSDNSSETKKTDTIEVFSGSEDEDQFTPIFDSLETKPNNQQLQIQNVISLYDIPTHDSVKFDELDGIELKLGSDLISNI